MISLLNSHITSQLRYLINGPRLIPWTLYLKNIVLYLPLFRCLSTKLTANLFLNNLTSSIFTQHHLTNNNLFLHKHYFIQMFLNNLQTHLNTLLYLFIITAHKYYLHLSLIKYSNQNQSHITQQRSKSIHTPNQFTHQIKKHTQ
jgi:hypothetical protein